MFVSINALFVNYTLFSKDYLNVLIVDENQLQLAVGCQLTSHLSVFVTAFNISYRNMCAHVCANNGRVGETTS